MDIDANVHSCFTSAVRQLSTTCPLGRAASCTRVAVWNSPLEEGLALKNSARCQAKDSKSKELRDLLRGVDSYITTLFTCLPKFIKSLPAAPPEPLSTQFSPLKLGVGVPGVVGSADLSGNSIFLQPLLDKDFRVLTSGITVGSSREA